MKLPLLAFLIVGTSYAMAQDILDTAQAYKPNVSTAGAKYNDQKLADAEVFLTAQKGKYPRPWTVPMAIYWLEQAPDDATRVNLMRLLAASRDPRAALILGVSLESKVPEIKSAAVDGLVVYFLPAGVAAGTEAQAASEWFKANKPTLDNQAGQLMVAPEG